MLLQRLTKFLFLFFFFLTVSGSASALNKHVVRVLASNCKYNKDRNVTNVLTGFAWEKNGRVEGIVTALHGVCGCSEISIEDPYGKSYYDLRITSADIRRDVALLSSSAIRSGFTSGLEFSSLRSASFANKNVTMIGFPLGLKGQKDSRLMRVRNTPLEQLEDGYVKDDFREGLKRRGSPYILMNVLGIEGVIVEGSSGSPILYNDQVIGIANGGLDAGVNTCWGIPVTDISFRPISFLGKDYADLEEKNPNELFPLSCGLQGGKPTIATAENVFLTRKTLDLLKAEFNFQPTAARARVWRRANCEVRATESLQCLGVQINEECTTLTILFKCVKQGSTYNCGGGWSPPINQNPEGALEADLSYKHGIVSVLNPRIVRIGHSPAETDCDNEMINRYTGKKAYIRFKPEDFR